MQRDRIEMNDKNLPEELCATAGGAFGEEGQRAFAVLRGGVFCAENKIVKIPIECLKNSVHWFIMDIQFYQNKGERT